MTISDKLQFSCITTVEVMCKEQTHLQKPTRRHKQVYLNDVKRLEFSVKGMDLILIKAALMSYTLLYEP